MIYFFKWSKQVLIIEQNVRTAERLKQQKKYASTLTTGEKALVVRWKQTVSLIFLSNITVFIRLEAHPLIKIS